MATQKYIEGFSYAANAASDLTGKENIFLAVQTDGRLDVAGNGGLVIGVAYEVDIVNRPVTAVYGSNSKVVVGTAVTAGQQIASDGAGKAKPALTTNYVVGIALESGAAGTVIEFAWATGYKP